MTYQRTTRGAARRHRRAGLLVWLVVLVLVPMAAAQSATISGTVTDERGEALPGVNVFIEALQLGSATDADGAYQIVVPPRHVNGQAVTLAARFLGFETGEAIVTLNAGPITQDFQLSADLLNLDEVVVTGTGTETSTKRLGINVESVDAEKLQAAPALTVESALQGKIAGANITQYSGQPGVAASITLRGINTLGDTTPMILIDGVEVSTDVNFAGNAQDGLNVSVNSRLADIDFNDVERVEVIKGAAAATIYGAQGANGVIQIFTKKGQAGRPTLTVGSSWSNAEALGEVPKAAFHHFPTNADGTIQGLERDPTTGQWTVPNVNIGPATTVSNPFVEQTYNALDLVLQDALTQRYNVSLSGGTPGFTYLLSANFQDQEGIQVETFNTRNSYRANFGLGLLDNLDIAVRTNFIESKNRSTELGDNTTGPLQNALFNPQFIDLGARDAEGRIVATVQNGDNSTNPLFESSVRQKDIETVRFINSLNASYRPLSWLELDYKLGVDHYRYEYDELQRNFEDNPIAALSPKEGFVWRIQDKSTNVNSLASAYLRFQADDRAWASTTQLAVDIRHETFDRTNSLGQGLPPFLQTTTLRSTAQFSLDQFKQDFSTYGFLVNEKLEWRDRIGLSGGGRFDYSSAFGTGEEAEFFPRGDVYIRLGEFGFWNGVRGVIPELKLRAAYGEAGIQPGPFDRIITLAQTQVGQAGTLLPQTTLQNARLAVEESREFEAGGDLTLRLSDRVLSPISIEGTYWTRQTASVIDNIDVAPSTGADDVLTNGIDIDSQGFDLALSALTFYTDSFNWRTTFNFGVANSTVGRIASGEDIIVLQDYLLREGEPVGSHFGFKAIRDLNETDPDGNLLLDANGDGVVDAGDGRFTFVDGVVVDADSRRVQFRPFQEKLGDAEPDFTLGFRNDFQIGRSLSLGVQLDWVQGPDIYNKTRQWLYRDLLHADVAQPVTIDGQTDAFAAYYTSLYKTNDKNEFFIEDGSFVRLREVSLSYDVAPLIGRRYVESLRLHVSGRNLLTWTDYTGFDPEVSHFGSDSRVRGLDEFTYPNFRTYTFGTTLRF